MNENPVGSFLEPQPPIKRLFTKWAVVARKNLDYDLGDSFEEMETEDSIKVFLRIKPCQSDDTALEVQNKKVVISKLPQTLLNKKKLVKNDNCKYTFSHIFGPEITQKEIFISCVERKIVDLLDGKNCLFFSYGTTNAGKTFTVQGDANNPGLIPRTIAMIFKSINNRLSNETKFCPFTTNSVLELNKEKLDAQMELKNKIVNWNPEKYINDLEHNSENNSANIYFKEMFNSLESDVKDPSIFDEDSFSVWVSFIEIYNERIYDLLQTPCDKKRPALKLAHDTYKNVYIKGLQYINVTSALEAYKVLIFGKKNLSFAATGMNASSSRSHCIFTIRVIRFTDINDPECMQISSLAMCDLAGAERQKNTHNVGDRLKESQNINCSLHVLSRCFNIIRENRLKSEKLMIPFRDSKLTQLFENALIGQESITMIVNVNPSIELYEETQHVLKVSAIARQIILEPKHKSSHIRLSRFSQVINNQKGSTSIEWDPSVKLIDHKESNVNKNETEIIDSPDYDKEYLITLVEKLQTKFKEERNNRRMLQQKNLTLEMDLRKELTTEFGKILEANREKYKEDLEEEKKI
uniref:Kinesin-like protein n=1 Tax=Clastoptera arizonana TaxID=38151 RepID=A0A1B6CSF6_9HEMI